MKKILTTTLLSLAFTAAASQGATVLIGGATLNGDLNAGSAGGDATDDSFDETPDWTNLGGAGTVQATRTNVDNDGTRNAVLSLAGDRIFGSDTGHSITTGEVFDISYVWRDAFNWNDNLDNVSVVLFTTADNTLTGAQTVLVTDLSGLSTANNTYEAVDHNGIYTAVGADAGKTLFVEFHGQAGVGSDTNGFVRLDDFVLEFTAVPEPSASLMALLGAGLLLRRRR